MSLHRDLLTQARELALQDRKKPRQANLRRAVSTAYYALFHLLAESGSYQMAPNRPPELHLQIRRAFDHAEMKQVCRQFGAGGVANLPVETRTLITEPLETSLIEIARTFVDLQNARHDADYNLRESFGRTKVLELIESVEEAFRNWKGLEDSLNRRVFLAALVFQRRWSK